MLPVCSGTPLETPRVSLMQPARSPFASFLEEYENNDAARVDASRNSSARWQARNEYLPQRGEPSEPGRNLLSYIETLIKPRDCKIILLEI